MADLNEIITAGLVAIGGSGLTITAAGALLLGKLKGFFHRRNMSWAVVCSPESRDAVEGFAKVAEKDGFKRPRILHGTSALAAFDCVVLWDPSDEDARAWAPACIEAGFSADNALLFTRRQLDRSITGSCLLCNSRVRLLGDLGDAAAFAYTAAA